MKLSELIDSFGLRVYAPPTDSQVEVAHGYASDLLSDVIANAGRDSLWVTMQIHGNIIAVAALKDVAAVVIVSDHRPADETIATAIEKGVCLLGTRMTTFETCGRFYAAGLRGEDAKASYY
ncbi:MAG: serine kinase [Syntrophales bacterium]